MRTGWLIAGMLAAGVAAGAQTPKNPVDTRPEGQQKQCSYTVTDENGEKITGTTNCMPKAAQDDTPIAKKFPYPGDPATAAPAADTPGAENPAKKFPYPGSDGGLKDAGSSGESSSSSGESSSSSSAPLSPDDVTSDTPPPPKRNHKPVVTFADKSANDQEAEDMQVGGFYLNDGNWRGAYGRATEAVKLKPEDPDAHLLLANSARKLGKLDEAEKQYRLTLTLDPVPKSRKDAERALKEMTGDH